MEIGVWVALGYFTQAIGLETSDSSVYCAFLCSLSVVRAEVQQAVIPFWTHELDKDIPSAEMLHNCRAAADTSGDNAPGSNTR